MAETWFLAWPDRVEPITWETYRKMHSENPATFHGSRGPFPSEAMAQDERFRDHVEGYWKVGLAVIARHCLGCGRYAKTLAFDSDANFAWDVTECERCGVIDSRTHTG